jgi:hypothetical protein
VSARLDGLSLQAATERARGVALDLFGFTPATEETAAFVEESRQAAPPVPQATTRYGAGVLTRPEEAVTPFWADAGEQAFDLDALTSRTRELLAPQKSGLIRPVPRQQPQRQQPQQARQAQPRRAELDPYERELDENRRLQEELDQVNQFAEIQQENERLRAELEEARSLQYGNYSSDVDDTADDEYVSPGGVRGGL